MTTSVLGAVVAGLMLYALPSGHEPATQLPKIFSFMKKDHVSHAACMTKDGRVMIKEM